MDIRSENETGKLLFKWDPDTDIISVACKDAVYDVQWGCIILTNPITVKTKYLNFSTILRVSL